MEKEQARKLAVDLMRAVLAIPGARRECEMEGESGIAFVEALGTTRFVFRYPEKDGEAAHMITGATAYLAHGFRFYASVNRLLTADEVKDIAPNIFALAAFDLNLGSDLVAP